MVPNIEQFLQVMTRDTKANKHENKVDNFPLQWKDDGSLCRQLDHKKLILPTFRLDALILLKARWRRQDKFLVIKLSTKRTIIFSWLQEQLRNLYILSITIAVIVMSNSSVNSVQDDLEFCAPLMNYLLRNLNITSNLHPSVALA